MRNSYLDYAMSVIVSRALPDVRDGLKPVHRRILFGMHELGLRPNTPYRKSAKIVGDVLGKYHPHGDSPVYDAMVRMAQDFSMRYPLVDGQGNFGSVDGDPPAAMRYSEARLAAIAEELLADIDENTVDFQPNYDGSEREPLVLPARLPNLLLNGSSGIAVGMATNIPPHHLGELCDAIAALIENPETGGDELAQIVKGPDFPTGGYIIGTQGIRNAYAEGQGRVIMRAKHHLEEIRNNRVAIIVTELPYQVNKATLLEKIADLVREKKIDGISDLRDESDRHGMRVVLELKREGSSQQVMNQLWKHTAMQSSFAVNTLCLVDGQPRRIGLKRALEHHIDHRREVIRRRTEFRLAKARDREHILAGLLKAIDRIDYVIRTIRGAESAAAAKEALMGRPLQLSDRQAQAVLDMALRRLAGLERQNLQDEYAEIIQEIAYLEDLLANPRKIDYVIRDDVLELKRKYGDDRRTEIIPIELEDFSDEDLVPHQETVVSLSSKGYIKRGQLEQYRLQRRGGRGITGMVTREADAVHRLVVADTHDTLLFFTDRGRVFSLKAHEVPDSKRQARGLPIINLIEIENGEQVTALVLAKDFSKDYMLMATAKGEVKKTPLKEFEIVRRNGKKAMDLEPGDTLVSAKLAGDGCDVMVVSQLGQALRFRSAELRSASRESGGVRGIRLLGDDRVVGMEPVGEDEEILVITEFGYGKRTKVAEYARKGRGGQGVRTLNITPKTGRVAAVRLVDPAFEVLLISSGGIVLRTEVSSIALIGRATQGVRVMNIGDGDSVAAIALIDMTSAP
jgi:DNA gyrase subunit A